MIGILMAETYPLQHKMEWHIETDRLILRELRLTDETEMFELDSNPAVHQYLGNNPISCLDQARAAIQNIRDQYAQNDIGRWATIEKSSGSFIGWSGLKWEVNPKNNKANYYDIGYRFKPAFWGKGYATEAAFAALEYGFNTMNLREIIGTCHEENIASRRALEKCGLLFVEKFMYGDLPCDWLRITREEWRARN